MKRTRNFVLALSASAMLALGATAPAFAKHMPEPPIPGSAPVTASEICELSEHSAPWCRHP